MVQWLTSPSSVRGFWGRMDIYMYGWVPSLFTWNYHNIVNRLYPNTKQKVKKKKTLPSNAGCVGSIRELKPHMLHGQKNQNIKQKQYHNKFNKYFKNDPHQKKKKQPFKRNIKTNPKWFFKSRYREQFSWVPWPCCCSFKHPFQQSLSFCHPKKVETNSNIGY